MPEQPTPAAAPEFEEFGGLWTRGFEIWGAYLGGLLQARTLDDLARVQTRFVIDGLDIVGQAAGVKLALQGQLTPTLNDP